MLPFKQIPIWEDNAKIEVTGKQLKEIKEFCDSISKFIPIIEDIFATNLNSGLIKVHYEDLEGNELSQEEVEKMFIELSIKHSTPELNAN